jgi:2-keto-4-pentenoate hydratase
VTDNAALIELARHLFSQRNTPHPNSHYCAVIPQSIEDAIAVQQLMINVNGAVSGWKCLVPQANGHLIVAPILSAAVNHSPVCGIIPSLKDGQVTALIEPEIAFILGQDIEPYRHYSPSEIDQVISATHMALELIQNRFSSDSQPSFYQKLADGLSNQGLYIGPEIDKSVAYKASHINVVVSELHQTRVEQSFSGEHPCDLPQNPLYWLINYLAQLGIKLSAGQAIITGSYCGVVKVPMATDISIEYKGIGQFDVKFYDSLA